VIDRETMIHYIRVATADVFTTMLGMEIEAGEPRFEQQAPAVTEGVFAFIGMAGEWAGSGTISCNAAFACRVCEQMLMTEAPSINDEVLDSMGELANMIIGGFKTSAEENVGPMGLSIPTVIYGRNFTSRSLGRAEWIVQPFHCEGGDMEIRICLAPAKPSCAAYQVQVNSAQ
jgi:chemotaxis protein CheX